MSLILGIDPGSLCTGFGLIRQEGSAQSYIHAGFIRTKSGDLSGRLQQVYQALHDLVVKYHPDQAAIEEVFLKNNPQSALKLGQARGAAIAAVAQFSVPVASYSARAVKKAIAGYGQADKAQMQQMVMRLLKLPELPQSDAADALAIAMCHGHTYHLTHKQQQMRQL